MLYGLAIHTGSPELGFAIDNFSGDQRSQAWNLGRDAASQLHDRLGQFFPPQTWQSLGFIAVAVGPGGFTGIRLGVVLARTLAQQLKIPLFGISSLMAIADAHRSELPPDRPIAIQMPAQRGQIYGAIYRAQATDADPVILPDQVFSEEAWQMALRRVSDVMLVEAIAEQGRYAPRLLAIAHQQWQAGAQPHWSNVLPYYGQHPVRG